MAKERWPKRNYYPVTTLPFHVVFEALLRAACLLPRSADPQGGRGHYGLSSVILRTNFAVCRCQAGDKCYIFNLGPARLSRDAWCIVTGCEDSRYVFAPSCCSQRPCCRKRALQSLCSTQEGFVLIMGCSFRRVHLSCVPGCFVFGATKA